MKEDAKQELRALGIVPIDPPPPLIQEIADTTKGTIDECGMMPDGSGFAMMSMELPKTHWIYGDGETPDDQCEEPPAVFRMKDTDRIAVIIDGQPTDELDAGFPISKGVTMTKAGFEDQIRRAGKYAIRASTMNGKDNDFDPDAMIRNLLNAFVGYEKGDCSVK